MDLHGAHLGAGTAATGVMYNAFRLAYGAARNVWHNPSTSIAVVS